MTTVTWRLTFTDFTFEAYGPALLAQLSNEAHIEALLDRVTSTGELLPSGVQFGNEEAQRDAESVRLTGETWPCLQFDDDLIVWHRELLEEPKVQRLLLFARIGSVH